MPPKKKKKQNRQKQLNQQCEIEREREAQSQIISKTVEAVQKAQKDPRTKHLLIRIGGGPMKVSTFEKKLFDQPVFDGCFVFKSPTIVPTEEDFNEPYTDPNDDNGNVISFKDLIELQKQDPEADDTPNEKERDKLKVSSDKACVTVVHI